MPGNADPQIALNDKRSVLEAIPADEVHEPPYPPDSLVGEGNALYNVAVRYRTQLNEVGVENEVIDDLPLRSQAVAGAQAARVMVPDTKRSAAEREAETNAVELRSDIYAAGRYATRKNAEAQSTLDKVSEGTDHDDLVQDLRDLGLFCTTYSDELKAIKFDPDAKRKEALALAAKFEGYLAERRGATELERQATDLRNRAVTHLWEAISTIRAAGSYRFRRDPTVLPLFRSSYRRRHRNGSGGGSDGQA